VTSFSTTPTPLERGPFVPCSAFQLGTLCKRDSRAETLEDSLLYVFGGGLRCDFHKLWNFFLQKCQAASLMTLDVHVAAAGMSEFGRRNTGAFQARLGTDMIRAALDGSTSHANAHTIALFGVWRPALCKSVRLYGLLDRT